MPRSHEALDQPAVAGDPVGAQAGQLVGEGARAGGDEVDEDVDAQVAEGAGHLAARDERDAELGRPGRRLLLAVEGVVVGEGQRRAPRLGRQLAHALGGSVPSERSEWVCRSITEGDPTVASGPDSVWETGDERRTACGVARGMRRTAGA